MSFASNVLLSEEAGVTEGELPLKRKAFAEHSVNAFAPMLMMFLPISASSAKPVLLKA